MQPPLDAKGAFGDAPAQGWRVSLEQGVCTSALSTLGPGPSRGRDLLCTAGC